jgi:hypothetical protein
MAVLQTIKKSVFILSAILLGAMIMNNDNLTEKVESNLNSYQLYYTPEKIYLHHDKPYYLAGEMIWLKAYILGAANLEASPRSGVLYVDLINDQNQKVDSLILPIEEGEAFGDFLLLDELPEGVYRIAAYTNWMRNFGEEFFFQKEIYILSVQNAVATKNLARQTDEIDLQFFPEGGDLIAGIPNEVAFKALNNKGYGTGVEGEVYDSEGKKVLDFKDHFLGMGSFVFSPEASKKYVARLNLKNGQILDIPLPQAKEKGYNLHIDEVTDPDNILIRIRSNQPEASNLFLFGIARDRLIHSQGIALKGLQWQDFLVPKSEFPTGVARFTLSDPLGNAFAERVVFINHPIKEIVEIQTEKKVFGLRDAVNLTISNKSITELSHLSISVTAEELVQMPEFQENIHTYLLLSSDLKGHIEFPAYYFESNDLERQKALRYLMMTQGWTRLGWETLVSGDFPVMRHANEMDLNIRGRLLRTNGSPVANGEAILYLKDKYTTFMLTPTNNDGYFSFRGFYFKGSIPVVIQGSDSRGRKEDVVVEMITEDYTPTLKDHLLRLPSQYSAQAPDKYIQQTQQQFKGIETEVWGMELGELLLQEVVVEGRADVFQPFKLHTRADAVLYRDQLPIAPSGNILEVLQGRVAGLQVTRTGMNEFRAIIRGQGTPLYLWDGIPISESTLQSINQFDINRIEILKGLGTAGIYGGRASGGVIAFFSETGSSTEDVDPEAGKHIIIHQALGYNGTRQFYSPSFDVSAYYDLPDLRSTVYWNPTVMVKPNSKTELSFYTGDIPGLYRVIVEGITKDGQPISEVHLFEVNAIE